MTAAVPVSLTQQLWAINEVLQQRTKGYPKLVASGKLKQSEANYRIAAVRAAWETLCEVDRQQREGHISTTLQARVRPWIEACFGETTPVLAERHHRFLEEALELCQSTGCTREEAHLLVDYVFDMDHVGEASQEAGGVMLTLAALSIAAGIDMHACGEVELNRVSTPEAIARIRAKNANKPRRSPLPGQA